MGIVRLHYNDEAPIDIDLYAPSYQYQRLIFERRNQPYAYHTLSAYWTGTKNPLASDTAISLDRIDLALVDPRAYQTALLQACDGAPSLPVKRTMPRIFPIHIPGRGIPRASATRRPRWLRGCLSSNLL